MPNPTIYPTFELECAHLSDQGMRRANNQDAVTVMVTDDEATWTTRGHFLMVADGMGAHAAGELASQLATDNIPHIYDKLRDLAPPAALRQAVREANSLIFAKGQSHVEFHGMGTTCSCLVLLPEGALVAHIGDSRVYRLRGNRLEQLTFDHSLVWEMAAAGQMAEEDVPAYIPKNVITRSLGPHTTVNVDLEGPYSAEEGDLFLLCSDGLSGPLSDEEIGTIARCLSPSEAVQTLVDLANLRGGPDNITVVIARVLNRSDGGARSCKTGSGEPRKGSFSLSSVFRFFKPAKACSSVATISGPYGNGPYREFDCQPGPSIVQELTGIAERLLTIHASKQLQIDWQPLEEHGNAAAQAAEANDYPAAIRELCAAIRMIMLQLRNSHLPGEGDSSIYGE